VKQEVIHYTLISRTIVQSHSSQMVSNKSATCIRLEVCEQLLVAELLVSPLQQYETVCRGISLLISCHLQPASIM